MMFFAAFFLVFFWALSTFFGAIFLWMEGFYIICGLVILCSLVLGVTIKGKGSLICFGITALAVILIAALPELAPYESMLEICLSVVLALVITIPIKLELHQLLVRHPKWPAGVRIFIRLV